MLKILSILILNQSLCLAQVLNIKNPEIIEKERERYTYKINKVKVLRITYENLMNINKNLNTTTSEILMFDTNGFVISATTIFANGRKITMTQNFDTLGNLLWFKQFFDDKLNHESRFYYNYDNILQSRVTINSKGELDSVPQEGRVEHYKNKKITTNNSSSLAAKIIEEINEKNIYKVTTLDKNGIPIQITEYQLNEFGQIKKEKMVKSLGGNIGAYLHTYSEEERLQIQTETYDRNFKLIEIIKKEYNQKGLLIKQTHFNTSGQIISIELHDYEYYE